MGLGHDHDDNHGDEENNLPTETVTDPCFGSKGTDGIPLALRIGSIFIILVVSLVGVHIPFAFRKM